MPIFEYTCPACGTTFERLVLRPQATNPIPCPQCGHADTMKVFSTFSTQANAGASASSTAGTGAFR